MHIIYYIKVSFGAYYIIYLYNKNQKLNNKR